MTTSVISNSDKLIKTKAICLNDYKRRKKKFKYNI